MDKKLREAQEQFLAVFTKKARSFALAGGTALELYYLRHRFSVDLDFFSPGYDIVEIEALVCEFNKRNTAKMQLESEFTTNTKARVRFYTFPIRNSERPLKVDFVEDVIFKKPQIKKIKGVRVYGVENIYLLKLIAVTGTHSELDEIGRQAARGRGQARDVFDIYVLSQKIKPLHIFLRNVSPQIQRGLVHWYRTFSRQDCKLALLDLDMYDKKFNAKNMIIHLEKEIELFMKEMLI